MSARRLLLGSVVVLGGCALKGDVRRVERQLVDFRLEAARSDSARAVSLGRILDELDRLQAAVMDSLTSQRMALLSLQGDFRSEITDVQRQLVTIQELTGQSQQRISQLRQDIETRARVPAVTDPQGTSGAPTAPTSAGPGPQELFQLGRQLVTQGSPNTARQAFERLIAEHPTHERAADAQLQIANLLQDQHPDSAEIMYEQVVANHPESPNAPLAIYRIGLLYERRGDMDTARTHFNRVVTRYPNSDEAALARGKLNNQ